MYSVFMYVTYIFKVECVLWVFTITFFMIDEKDSLDKQMLDKLIWKMSCLDLCKHFTNIINLQQCQTKPLLDWTAQ